MVCYMIVIRRTFFSSFLLASLTHYSLACVVANLVSTTLILTSSIFSSRILYSTVQGFVYWWWRAGRTAGRRSSYGCLAGYTSMDISRVLTDIM